MKEVMVSLRILTIAGGVFRLIFCLIKISTDENESARYKKRLRNAIIFTILLLSIEQIAVVLQSYY